MINGVTYRMKDGDGSRKTGVIAQDVEKVFPELIVENSNGYKSVSYDKLVAPLIEAVKIQQVRIEELETRLQKMETAGN
ncbi:MAG: hypothetical protein QG650_630 [Patescibacteria group bacterium]|nr:hypothetical protein [Patescibacteria group bacterium]